MRQLNVILPTKPIAIAKFGIANAMPPQTKTVTVRIIAIDQQVNFMSYAKANSVNLRNTGTSGSAKVRIVLATMSSEVPILAA